MDYRLDQSSEISKFAKLHWELGLSSAVLVTVPPPTKDALDAGYLEEIIKRAMVTAENSYIKGSEITPFLLLEVAKATNEKSLKVNLSLLLNNAKIVAEIAENLVKG